MKGDSRVVVSRLHVVLALPTSLVVEPPVERFLLALLLPGRVRLLLALAEVGRVGLPLARPLQPGLRFQRALLVADPRRLGQVPGLQGRLEPRPEPLLHRHKMSRVEANERWCRQEERRRCGLPRPTRWRVARIRGGIGLRRRERASGPPTLLARPSRRPLEASPPVEYTWWALCEETLG